MTKKEVEQTTILIRKTTRAALNKAGLRGETYDEIITRLLEGKK